jgi:ADP-sugar diphosphatase
MHTIVRINSCKVDDLKGDSCTLQCVCVKYDFYKTEDVTMSAITTISMRRRSSGPLGLEPYKVPVYVTGTAASLTEEQLMTFAPLWNWSNKMDPALYVESVTVTDVHWFGPRIGFMTIKTVTRLMGEHGPALPGIIFLRGGSVAMLVVLRCEGRKYVLLVKQPRVAVGRSALIELPAGMLDGDGNFAGVAAKEMREEAHIDFKPSEMLSMSEFTQHKQFPSPGGCDEFIEYFYASAAVTPAFLRAIDGRATGVEDERIRLSYVPYEDLWCATGDAKAAVACHLFENLVRNRYMADEVTTMRVFRSEKELAGVAEELKEE